MSDRKRHAPQISGPRDYIYALTDDKELIEVITQDRFLAAQARETAMGNVPEALRNHLYALFRDAEKREISIQRSRQLLGITTADEQIQRMFEEFSAKRTLESLVMEYDYILGMASLVSATRHAINEVSMLAPDRKIKEVINVLETVIKVVSRYTKLSGAKKIAKGKAFGEMNLLTPEASIEMIELTVTSNLKNTVAIATKLNEVVKSQQASSSRELIVTPQESEREWIRTLIEGIINRLRILLAYFEKKSQAPITDLPSPTVPKPIEETIIDNTLTSLKAISTQLRIILVHLEQRPGLFVYHHFELLRALSETPEQTLGGVLKDISGKGEK